jgi:hypothetical protein
LRNVTHQSEGNRWQTGGQAAKEARFSSAVIAGLWPRDAVGG